MLFTLCNHICILGDFYDRKTLLLSTVYVKWFLLLLRSITCNVRKRSGIYDVTLQQWMKNQVVFCKVCLTTTPCTPGALLVWIACLLHSIHTSRATRKSIVYLLFIYIIYYINKEESPEFINPFLLFLLWGEHPHNRNSRNRVYEEWL